MKSYRVKHDTFIRGSFRMEGDSLLMSDEDAVTFIAAGLIEDEDASTPPSTAHEQEIEQAAEIEQEPVVTPARNPKAPAKSRRRTR